jgi:alkanesulfonate monooxygenase SsuD/methylene tetrahydromethanopterin reductase-like flavin-dependent oxidoreductase (luciferase family)
MRIGVNLGPTSNWTAMLEATKQAESLGYDAVGVLDHYHSGKTEWGYISGWSLYGALAMATTKIKLIPLVICRLNHLPGVLAKETAMLSILSQERFELGIGAGDFFQEMVAWNVPIPKAPERIEELQETIQVLRQAWKGESITFEGKHIQVRNGLCVPSPRELPRVVIGVGNSRKLLRSAVEYADEVNVYADEEMIRDARKAIEDSGKNVGLSAFIWEWQDDIERKLKEWKQLGVERTFVTFWEPFDKLEQIAQYL